MINRPALPAYALAAIIVLLVGALSETGHSAPDWMAFLATAALGAGAGVSVPTAAAVIPSALPMTNPGGSWVVPPPTVTPAA